MRFSQILQEWKDRVGWTDQQIADAMVPPMSRAAVNQWLNDKHPPDLSNLPALGALLGRDWVELAAIILGEKAGRVGGMSQAQASLLAQTGDLSAEQIETLQKLIEVLYPRKPKTKSDGKPKP